MKKKNQMDIIPIETNMSIIPIEREGIFKQGRDKLGRPYETKEDGKLRTKAEVLKTGKRKLTITEL